MDKEVSLVETSKCKMCGAKSDVKISKIDSKCPNCDVNFPTIQITCPECGSMNFDIKERKYNWRKAIIGALLWGILSGLFAGTNVSNELSFVCSECGKKWHPKLDFKDTDESKLMES